MTSLHADDAFLSHYQFSHDPFAPRVPGFKFFPAQRKPVLGQLHHLARYSQLLLVVCGPQGSGKTLLRQALVASTNKQLVHSLVLSGRDAAVAGGVYRQVAAGLEAAAGTLDAILLKAGQMALTGQEVYLLVDDAEHLDAAALESLLLLAAGSAEGRLHVFLFAESSLVERMDQLTDGEEGCHAIALQPYTEQETREYLAQRLEGAGQDIDLLSDEQIEEIHLQSEGWPGAINQVARDVMLDAMLAQSNVRTGGHFFGLPGKHLLALAVVGVALAAAWMTQGGPDEAGSEPVEIVSETLPLPAPAPVEPVQLVDEAPVVEFAGGNAELPLVAVEQAQPVVREPLAQAAGQDEPEDAGVAPAELDETSAAANTTTLPLPLPEVQPAPISQQLPPPVVTPERPIAKSAEAMIPVQAPAVAPVVQAKPVVKPAPAAASVPVPSAWYQAQVATRITLQVLGTGVEQNARALVGQLGAESHYYLKMHQGKPFYVVTYGVFSDRTAAQAALKGLPAKVQAAKPFPKSFASIQQEMHKSR